METNINFILNIFNILPLLKTILTYYFNSLKDFRLSIFVCPTNLKDLNFTVNQKNRPEFNFIFFFK